MHVFMQFAMISHFRAIQAMLAKYKYEQTIDHRVFHTALCLAQDDIVCC